MNTKLAGIIASVKKMRPMDFVYPGILLLFFITVMVTFFLSTKFISGNINKVFSTEQGDATQALDLTHYTLAAKKLHIPVNTQGNEVAPLAPTPTPSPVSSTTVIKNVVATSTASTQTQFNKSALSIAVYNGTKTPGLAGKLKSALEAAGFTVKISGNKTGDHSETIIEIKDSAQPARAQIEKIVGDQYKATTNIAPVDAQYDVVIIIGTR